MLDGHIEIDLQSRKFRLVAIGVGVLTGVLPTSAMPAARKMFETMGANRADGRLTVRSELTSHDAYINLGKHLQRVGMIDPGLSCRVGNQRWVGERPEDDDSMSQR